MIAMGVVFLIVSGVGLGLGLAELFDTSAWERGYEAGLTHRIEPVRVVERLPARLRVVRSKPPPTPPVGVGRTRGGKESA